MRIIQFDMRAKKNGNALISALRTDLEETRTKVGSTFSDEVGDIGLEILRYNFDCRTASCSNAPSWDVATFSAVMYSSRSRWKSE